MHLLWQRMPDQRNRSPEERVGKVETGHVHECSWLVPTTALWAFGRPRLLDKKRGGDLKQSHRGTLETEDCHVCRPFYHSRFRTGPKI